MSRWACIELECCYTCSMHTDCNEHLPLSQRTEAELIRALCLRESELRTFSQRGYLTLNILELMRCNALDRQILAIRAELESRTISATI